MKYAGCRVISNHSPLVQIRKKMVEIITRETQSCDLKELVQKFIPEVIGKEIEKATAGIYPLQNTFIRKVKILKSPKFDLGKLMEVRALLGVVSSVCSSGCSSFALEGVRCLA